MQIPERSLRILLVTNNYTPYAGGLVNSLQTTMQSLRTLGHRPLLVTLDFAGHPFEADVIRLYCPFRFTYFSNPMAVPLYAQRQLTYIIKRYNPDLIHVQHPFLLGPAAVCVAQQYKIPTLFTYHTQYQVHTHYLPLPCAFAKPVVARLVRTFCNGCDGIIMPSNAINTHCSWLQVPRYVIPSGIDERYYTNASKPLSQPIQLLTVGRMVPEKKVTTLLDAVSLLDQNRYTLTLIGYGYQYEYLQYYAYEIKKLSPATVQFIHKPSKEVIADWYARAHLFLFAAPHDTQGLVLAEAMAARMPVIALPGPGQEEIIQQGYNGFIVTDAQQMAAMINSVAAQPTLYEQLQEGAWQTAQSYRPQVCARQLAQVYQSLVSKMAR